MSIVSAPASGKVATGLSTFTALRRQALVVLILPASLFAAGLSQLAHGMSRHGPDADDLPAWLRRDIGLPDHEPSRGWWDYR